MSALRLPAKALDLVSVLLVALGLAPAGAVALVPACISVAAEAFVRRRQGRAFGAAALALACLAGALWSTRTEQPESVSSAFTFGALVALLVAVVFGPSRGSEAAAGLTAACRRENRTRVARRAPARRLRTES